VLLVKKLAHAQAASGFSVSAATTAALAKKWLASWTLPGSTAMSQLKGASAKAENIQMPVVSIARLPLLKKSPSETPARSSSVGWIFSTLGAATMYSRASTQAGSLMVTLPSGPKTPQPFWAAVL